MTGFPVARGQPPGVLIRPRAAYSPPRPKTQGNAAPWSRPVLARSGPAPGASSISLLELRPRLQNRDPSLELLVFLARQARHLFDRLEFLARDHVEFTQHTLGLGAEQGLDLTPHPLRSAGGIVHQPRHFVKEPVAGLCHR